MEVVRGSMEVEEWRPPPDRRAPAASALSQPVRRGIAGAVVLALHIAAALLFALPPTLEGTSGRSGSALSMELAFVTLPPVTAAPAGAESAAIPSEPVLTPPAIEILEPPATDDADTVLPTSNEFRPPTLQPQRGPTVAHLAANAGMVVRKSSRVILTVDVTAGGTAGEVKIVVSSGDAKLDTVAVEYARTLRWLPALVQGRETSMSIRLPVVFPATD